jgi:integrase
VGTIFKRDDKFRASVRLAGHPSVSKSFATEREAKRWIRETERALEGRDVRNPDVVITALIERYAQEIAPKRRMADSHLGHDIPSILVKFKGMQLSDLRGRGLVDWVLSNGLSNSTSHWHLARLSGVLRQAEVYWDIPIPWEDIKLAKAKLTEGGYIHPAGERDRRVTDAEIAAIKAFIGKHPCVRLADMIDFAVATAMRVGEICRIQWSDLDAERRTILIRDRKHPTKKFGNDQSVPLLGDSLAILQRQPRRDARIWPHCTTYISKVFHKAVVKAGVGDVVFHDLRHEGISRLFEAGFQIPEVALVSGHKDWKSLRRYTNLRPGDLIAREAALRKAA